MRPFDTQAASRGCLWTVHRLLVALRRIAWSGDEEAVRAGLTSLADALDALVTDGPSRWEEVLRRVRAKNNTPVEWSRPVPDGSSNLTSEEVASLLAGFSDACRLLAGDTALGSSELARALDELEYIAPEALRLGREFVVGLHEPRAGAHVAVVARRFAGRL